MLTVSFNDSPRWKSFESRGRLFRISTVIKEEWCGFKIDNRNIIEYNENNIKYLLNSIWDITIIRNRVHPWTSTCIPPLLLWDQLCMPMMSVCSTSRLLKLIVVRISYQKLIEVLIAEKKTKKKLSLHLGMTSFLYIIWGFHHTLSSYQGLKLCVPLWLHFRMSFRMFNFFSITKHNNIKKTDKQP